MVEERAPSRGRYDRGRSRAERFREQYLRLLGAAGRAERDGVETVSYVVGLAGAGRNTFYECFDDFAHALRAARGEAALRMRAALDASGDADGSFDAMARAWVD